LAIEKIVIIIIEPDRLFSSARRGESDSAYFERLSQTTSDQ
jgi:hypothetical protein